MAYQSLKSLYYQDRAAFESEYNVRINGDSTYLTQFFIGEKPAFVVMTLDLHALITRILALNERVLDISAALPAIALRQFSTQSIVEEVSQTLNIEHVRSTRREIINAMDSALDPTQDKRKLRLAGIVRGYVLLFSGEHIPLRTCQDIRALYDWLCLPEVVEENPRHAPDGLIFRADTVYVTRGGEKPLHQGVSPENMIIQKMDEALRVAEDERIDVLVRIALFHYFLEYIHPFYDGNGRLGRFAASAQIARHLRNPLIGLRLSYTIHERRNEYHKMIKDANDPKNFGDMTVFVERFLKLIEESLEGLLGAIEVRHDALRHYEALIVGHAFTDMQRDVIYTLAQVTLFGGKGITFKDLAQAVGASYSTVQRIIRQPLVASVVLHTKQGNKQQLTLDLDKLEAMTESVEKP